MNTAATALISKIRFHHNQLSLIETLLLSLGMALMIGLLAQVRIPLPFTPVPITGQTFAVLLAGPLLGRRAGSLAIVFYLVLGLAGLPVFTGWQSGLAAITRPTAGYLVGFAIAAYVLGSLTDAHPKFRRFKNLLPLMAVVNFGIIFPCGLAVLGLWQYVVTGGTPLSVSTLLTMGLIPFIPGAVIKIVLASSLASLYLKKSNH